MKKIRKISKLKNFGIFHDFSWSADTPEFQKFNLIYGWNRSGKTTLSRAFASCEKKCVYDEEIFKQYPEHGKFEIILDNNTKIKETDVDTGTLPVKVFNQDFIDENISFDPSIPSKPIVYISAKDIQSQKDLKQLKIDKDKFDKEFENTKGNKKIKKNIIDNFLSGLGREIANALFDKSYNKTKVENKINSIEIDDFPNKILSSKDKKNTQDIIISKIKNTLPPTKKLEVFDYKSIVKEVNILLQKKVVSDTLKRLKDPLNNEIDQDLNTWVKQGFEIHKSKKQLDKCFFCDNKINEDMFNKLEKHFSKDYEELQKSIKSLINVLEEQSGLEEIAQENHELYPDLKGEYEDNAKTCNQIIKEHKQLVQGYKRLLEEKHKNPFAQDISKVITPAKNYIEKFNKLITDINAIISTHNNRVKNHNTTVIEEKKKLELHLIAVAISKVDYKKIISELEVAEKSEKKIYDIVKKIIDDIKELEEKNSDIGKALKEINKHLKYFFGREEIKLVLDLNNMGYIIKRDGRIAENLSEGEKTAIAFSYFIVKVTEEEFNIKNGIIFIDDPISSFDSNYIYHCFYLINVNFKEAGQLFISTHNFQLFNLVKTWFNGKRNSSPALSAFFMTDNFLQNSVRNARLVKLDKTLQDYKSEYHFLFSLLNKLIDRHPDYEDLYTIANIARRFFNIFADFKIPNLRNQKEKMEAIVIELNKRPNEKGKIENFQWYKVYKLFNEFSHNSDSMSLIQHTDKNEIIDAIKILLDIVERSDPLHYKTLKDASNL